jgi:isopropylmalate/homocitrate/citramalate synthase
MMLPDQVKIVEVGPRDGLQNEAASLEVEVRVELIKRLMACGLEHIEAGSFVRPDRVPQMADTHGVLSALPLDGNVSFPVLVPNPRGLSNAIDSGAREIAIFAAATDTFSQKNINCSIDESLSRFEEVARTALDHGMKVRGYISCVMGCPYEGEVAVNAVSEVANRLIEMGCYEISLGDTIGTGTPGRTQDLIETLSADIDSKILAVHFHDTYGQALANIYAALETGISIIDSSIAGLGGCPYARGASGNVATEDVVYMLNGLGIEHGTDLDRLVSVGRFICNKLERPMASKVNLAMPES